MEHYPAYICENGHEVCVCSDECADNYCRKCGARIISRCPNCEKMIEGVSRDDIYALVVKYSVPSYCPSCGKPYPWIANAIESATYMIQESDLSVGEQNKLVEVLPDIITDTPRTQLAALRIQKAMANGGKFLAEGLRQFAIEFGCEILKNKLGF